jgi:glucosamine 6-phosphate synthetase-like amidotransferase/phosphosugar isomerase protein
MGCGIGGVSTSYPFTEKEAKICWRLLHSLQRRGRDAWGYFDGSTVYKEPGAFDESTKYFTLVKDLLRTGTNLFLCHTRMATQGDPEENKNNHPFELGDFVFAHNGVLYYTDEFENVYGIETDSFWMLYWIQKEYERLGDVIEAIRAGVSHVSGVYACWLHKRAEGATYLFRISNPIMETHSWRGEGVTVFGSDWLSIVDAFSVPGVARMFKFFIPDVIPLRPVTIYKLMNGILEEDGTFEPRRPELGDLVDFELRQGHLMRYHIPLVSGRGLNLEREG